MDLEIEVPALPLQDLGNDPIREIASHLDVTVSSGRDYRIFGEKLGILPQTVRQIGANYRSPTAKIFNEAISMGKTVADVQNILVDMQCAAADVLPRYVQEIERVYWQRITRFRGVQHSCSCNECLEARTVSINPSIQCRCWCHGCKTGAHDTAKVFKNRPCITESYSSTSPTTKNVSPEILERLSISSDMRTCASKYCEKTLSYPEQMHVNRKQRPIAIQHDPTNSFNGRIMNGQTQQYDARIVANSLHQCEYDEQTCHSNSVSVARNMSSRCSTAGLDNVSLHGTGSYRNDNQLNGKIPGTRSDASRKIARMCLCTALANSQLPNAAGPVFITYSEDATNEMVVLMKHLLSNRIEIKFDLWTKTLNAGIADSNTLSSFVRNANDWIQFQLHKAKYIIILLSDQYVFDISPPQTKHSNAAEDEDEDEDQSLHTRFIHNILRKDVQNGSNNYRVIPVALPSRGTRKLYIPDYLKSTVIFDYPDQLHRIVDHILDR